MRVEGVLGAPRRVRAVVVTLVLLSGLFVAAASAPAPAQANPSSLPEVTDSVDGTVFASVQLGDRTFIGGTFTWSGPYTGAAVPTDLTTGKRLSIPKVNGVVRVAVPDGAGGWYVGGEFVYAGGKVRNGAARINSTGFVTAWNPQPVGSVRAIAVSNGVVYLGGTFTTVGGQARSNIAAVDATSGAIRSWNPGANGQVNTLVVSADGASIYAGGAFSSIGGAARPNLAEVSVATGAGSSWNPQVDGPVNDVEVSGASLYVGGAFTSAGGAPRANLAELNAATALATTWDPSAGGPVKALASTPDTVFVGGSFATAGGQPRANLAAISRATGVPTAFAPDTNGAVNSLSLNATFSTVYAGGAFTTATGLARRRAAAFAATTGALTAWDPSSEGEIYGVVVVGSRVLVAGNMIKLNGFPRSNVAAIRADGSTDPSWDPGTNNTVYALAASDDGTKIFLGGLFTTVNGAPRGRLAAVNVTTGTMIPGWLAQAAGNGVRALATKAGRLYVGGTFLRISGMEIDRLAAFSQSTGAIDPNFAPHPNNSIRALTISPDGTKLYVGGLFTSIAGVTRPGAAELNAATGTATTFAPIDGGVVYSMALTPNGARWFFMTTNGKNYAYDTGSDNQWEFVVRTGGDVQAMAASATEVYIGGHFSSLPVTHDDRNHLASFYVADGTTSPWVAQVNGIFGPWTITITPRGVAVGGDFDKANGTPQKGFAHYAGPT